MFVASFDIVPVDIVFVVSVVGVVVFRADVVCSTVVSLASVITGVVSKIMVAIWIVIILICA